VLPVHPRNGGAVVLAVANLEGGVGKTTIATHLAGYFAQSAPTLFIDMDYQGSGSTQLLRASGADGPAPESRVERLMGGDGIDVKQLLPISLGARAPGLAVVPSFHSLSRFEDRLMLRWMIGDETDDIRKRLCEALRSQEFQSRFRFIVIDCPPRMTTGMVNALWASTHLLIPTELTKTASEASIYFLERLNVLKQNGFLRGMKIVGVLPSMVESPPRDAHQGPAEKLLREQIDDQSALVLKEQSISRNVAFAKAAATDLVHLAIDSSSESSRRAWKQICDLGDYLRKGFEHDATGVGQPPA
jgi:chromosome partitioning protein